MVCESCRKKIEAVLLIFYRRQKASKNYNLKEYGGAYDECITELEELL